MTFPLRPSKTYYFVLHLKINIDFTFSSFLIKDFPEGPNRDRDMAVEAVDFFHKTPLEDNEKGLIFLVRDFEGSDLLSILLRKYPLSPSLFNDLVLAIEKTDDNTKETIRSVLKEKGIPDNQFYIFEYDLPCDFEKSYDVAMLTLVQMQIGKEQIRATKVLLEQFGQVMYGNSFC
jgi:hypothetical protein